MATPFPPPEPRIQNMTYTSTKVHGLGVTSERAIVFAIISLLLLSASPSVWRILFGARVINAYSACSSLLAFSVQELGEDWTAAFRSCESVQEYILVGEADTGVCGCALRTWGRERRHDAEHVKDGFERLDGVGDGCLHMCKTDDPWLSASRSKMVSFVRSKKAESS